MKRIASLETYRMNDGTVVGRMRNAITGMSHFYRVRENARGDTYFLTRLSRDDARQVEIQFQEELFGQTRESLFPAVPERNARSAAP